MLSPVRLSVCLSSVVCRQDQGHTWNQVGSNPGKRIQMNIDNIFYIIKSAIISDLSDLTQVTAGLSPCLSTQLNEHLCTQVLKHLNVHIYLVSIAYRYQLILSTDHFHNNNISFPLTSKVDFPFKKSITISK